MSKLVVVVVVVFCVYTLDMSFFSALARSLFFKFYRQYKPSKSSVTINFSEIDGVPTK